VSRFFPLLEPLDPCPVCGSRALRILHTYQTTKAIAEVANLVVVGCEQCGIVFSHPLPSEAQLHTYYTSPEGWQRRVADEDGPLQNPLKLERRAEEWNVVSTELPTHDAAQGRPRVLDFGCGTGAYLDVLAERGWETVGLEPGPTAAAFAAERHTMVETVPDEPAFELVIAYHVLEHLRDPLESLVQLQGSLRPGGHVLLSVPDLGGLGRHGKFKYVISGLHIFSYTSASLSELCARAGLEKVRDSHDPEWSVLREENPTRLRFLARKADGEVVTASGEPLKEALNALRLYGDARFARQRGKGSRTGPSRRPRSRVRRLLGRLLERR